MKGESKLTAAEIEAKFVDVRKQISEMSLSKSGVIEDYPIGGRNRWKCKLEFDVDSKKGWRTVKTTTSKSGQWCAPKKSTYRDHGGVAIASGEGVERDYQWVCCTLDGVFLTSASYEHTWLFESPLSTIVVHHKEGVSCYGHKFEADTPEFIAAHKAWLTGYELTKRMIAGKLEEDGAKSKGNDTSVESESAEMVAG